MTKKRLPSFNDFSPKILNEDVRPCLRAIRDFEGDDKKIIATWANNIFGGKQNKRSSTNIPATLRSLGLSSGSRPLSLSPLGEAVLAAQSPEEAAQVMCAHVIKQQNGDVLLDALRSLKKRGEKISKDSLKKELKRLGITSLATATTDHTTLKNWMRTAGILDGKDAPNDALLKQILGISATEMDEWANLTLAQQVFLTELRRAHVVSAGPFPSKDLLRPCIELYPDIFDESQFAKKVQKPLVDTGWMQVSGLASGVHGGKSGSVLGSAKLLAIPVDLVIPDFESVVPADLRSRIDTPLEDIRTDLLGTDKHKGGLALELLALRMVLDLGLDPRNFRLRSAQSGFAEVDLLAEGSHLMFSRWTFQCKRYERTSGTKAGLGEVAKEVGIAIFVKAHVVVMVSTTGFTKEAIKYAESISEATPLQFLFIDGEVIDAYLANGKSALLEHARANAAAVMKQKRSQPTVPIPLEEH